ncbi:M24 family metallopeptidase [Acidianus sulfidivorans JP7]|uniref:Aminopeptidase P family protein n=1 Tax=Acidianus sulfidivorans JP7 TaxID=619593 RepID=A0A2U9INB8_9CREN|nr:Xaa-Pro peptidase family protein [Acidianus sulfidivorans]AWR97505.1 M24 family metallopeptidase [Acidianus sulfidivorans JP7]
MDTKSRIEKLRSKMIERDIDETIIGTTSNMFYLTNFIEEQMERPLFFIVNSEEQYFLAPKIYEEQLSKLGFDIITYNDGEDAYSKLKIRKNEKIAIDDQLWSVFLINIIHKFSPKELISASSILKELRMRKDEEELKIMMEGISIAEKSFLEFLNRVAEGKTECELAKTLENIFYDFGAEGVSFSPILTSGPNTSMPHLRCTSRKVKQGDILIADFGIKYHGYSTDTTRVISLGKPSEEIIKIYEIVLEAQEKAEKESKTNMLGKEIDNLAREVISRKGYGSYFIHRTGHGIGIDVHEDPYISQDSETKIDERMTFTIEPGIYLPGKFGIRIENMEVMEKNNVKPFNKLSKEIYVV